MCFISVGYIPRSGIVRSLFFFFFCFFLFQFPNEEDSFHKFVAPEEVLPFTEGNGSYLNVCVHRHLCVLVSVLVLMVSGIECCQVVFFYYHTSCGKCSL